jgi:hypothetical protein
LSRAIALDPNSTLVAEALLLRAARYEAAGDLARAQADFKHLPPNATEEEKAKAAEGATRVQKALAGP